MTMIEEVDEGASVRRKSVGSGEGLQKLRSLKGQSEAELCNIWLKKGSLRAQNTLRGLFPGFLTSFLFHELFTYKRGFFSHTRQSEPYAF